MEFAPGSQIRRLERNAFTRFTGLKSVCIPASVEFLGRECFYSRSPYTVSDRWPGRRASESSLLESVAFQPGSKLREIESGAFCGCDRLKRICVRASVEKMNAASFPRSQNCRIALESGNRYFAIRGAFLMNFKGDRLVRYCGTSSEVVIGEEIEYIGKECFSFCKSIHFVRFGPMSRLSSIESRAFWSCANLETISIPSPVTLIGKCCFDTP
jgi:hypothetical protein